MDTESRLPTDELLQMSLTDVRCQDRYMVGEQIRALALAREVLSDPGTFVLSGPIAVWRRRIRHGVVPTGPTWQATSLRGWLVCLDEPDRPVGPVLNNLTPGTLPEALIEFVALAERLSAGRPHERLVLVEQRFVPPEASVLAEVHRLARRLRLRACWGVAEQLADPVYYDEFVLAAPGSDPEETDGLSPHRLVILHERVVSKPTATLAQLGGTETRPVPIHRQDVPVLDHHTARSLGTVALAIADRLRQDAELELRLRKSGPYLVSCQPI